MHAALLLAVVMISLAVLYAALDAPFLFAVQIIVYTGAILMLFLFVLMLVGVDASDSVVETIRGQRVIAIARRAAVGLVLVIGIGQVTLGRRRPRRRQPGRQHPGPGQLLFSRYVFAFEVTTRAADHRCGGRHGARPPRAAHARSLAGRPRRPADARLRRPGRAPRPLPAPGVYARHNAVDTPALLPDGTASEASVSRVLAARGTVRSAPAMAEDIEELKRQLGAAPSEAGDAGRDGGPASTEEDVT